MQNDPDSGYTAGLKEDNLFEWIATILGPVDSPYEGGIFFVNIQIPIEYPKKAPIVCQFPFQSLNANIFWYTRLLSERVFIIVMSTVKVN